MRVGLMYPAPDPASPSNWSGTPRGLHDGLIALGAEVVPIAYEPQPLLKAGAAVLSRLAGGRGTIAHRSPVQSALRSRVLRRNLRRAAPLDAVLAMGTEMYDLADVVPDDVPVATYDDGTLQLIARYLDSEVRRAGFPQAEVERWIERQAASSRGATVCCVSTRWAARSMVEDYGVPTERVHVVGMGHRPRVVPDGARDWSVPRFLFVGLDWGRKNGDAVVAAFAQVREKWPEATLDLVGAHPDVNQPGVIEHGTLRREVESEQRLLDGLFARATAFVLPSRFDPSPIAYLEAASAGLPVIATTEGGAGELLGPAAITVHPDDHEALLAGMLHLAEPENARPMGAEAATRAATSDWVGVASRILASLGLAQH